jgi:aryl-alcohol dehydrogenase-like predicted oxidoreductase
LLKLFAEKKKATSAQIALAWLLAQKPWIVPIPGTRREDHLAENLGAIDIVLTPAELSEIESAFLKVEVQGARLSEPHMQQIDLS